MKKLTNVIILMFAIPSLLGGFSAQNRLPVLIEARMTGETEFIAVFDREVAEGTERRLEKPLAPGAERKAEITATDPATGYRSRLEITLTGVNPRLPAALINEFTTKGNARHPDRTEILFLSEGSALGLTLTDGREEFVFPEKEVAAGDIYVHTWKDGLSMNNGRIELLTDPGRDAEVIDAVMYTNKNASESTAYWSGQGLDSRLGSATKSFSRKPDAPDTDSADDWFVTPVRGASFGEPNFDPEEESL